MTSITETKEEQHFTPWKVVYTTPNAPRNSFYQILSQDDVEMARVDGSSVADGDRARLIASAPAMFQALQRLAFYSSRSREDYPDQELYDHTIARLDAANRVLAQARGEKQ